jgi:phospholipase A-2-activating protein
MFYLHKSYEGHSGDIKGIAETQDSLVSCSRDCSVRLWQLDKSYVHQGYVNSLSAAEFVVSGSSDKTIIVSDKGEEVGILIGHTDNVCALDICDDLILSGSWDSTIKLWKNFECILTIEGHQFAVWDVKFVQNYLLSASADKTIKLWDMHGKLLITFLGHTDVVRSLGIIPQIGFVSCSNDAYKIKD